MGLLRDMNDKFVKIMQQEKGVLGAWEFGSAMHGTTDEYSDIDIVFLVEQSDYCNIDDKVKDILEAVCDKVVLFWAEDFNGDAMKNYDCIVEIYGKLFQYDIFLLNQEHINDNMCQLHYMNLRKEDIIFSVGDVVERLIEDAPNGQVWNGDVMRLVDTYWLHVYMSAKYFNRKDYFKLAGVLRILMDIHTSLLLTVYDKTTWGGTANKLHYLTEEKQNHLKKYYCSEDFDEIKKNLWQSICWFENDIVDMGNDKVITYSREIGGQIKKAWTEMLKK